MPREVAFGVHRFGYKCWPSDTSFALLEEEKKKGTTRRPTVKEEEEEEETTIRERLVASYVLSCFNASYKCQLARQCLCVGDFSTESFLYTRLFAIFHVEIYIAERNEL